MAVYYDVVNRTFLFAPVYGTIHSVQGTVYSGSTTNVAGTEVVMIANGVRYRTFANARGQYRFPGTVSGPVQLQAGGVTTQLYAVGAAEEVDIDVP